MNNLIEIYCAVDDFVKIFLPGWKKTLIATQQKKRNKPAGLSESEVVTLLILFHQSNYKTLKHFYLDYVCCHLSKEFPTLVSYSRFVRLQQSVLIILAAYLDSQRGKNTGISFVDSTSLAVCHNKRIQRNRVFKGIATRGKTTMGWFFGFKLHLIVNDCGELLAFQLSKGNTDDRTPVPALIKGLTGKLFGDRGYISKKLFEECWDKGLHLVTSVRKKMKNHFLPMADKILLRKRFIIETINDQLKNISQIEHSRHRSVINFFTNLLAGLSAYCHQPKKPSLNLSQAQKDCLNSLALMRN
jgi:hypothetical protein